MADLLPNSLPVVRRGQFRHAEMWYTPVYCANCGKRCGAVGEQDFAFWLCNPCAQTHGNIPGTVMVPDEVYWAKVKDAQLERYGRELTPTEVLDQLRDPESMVSKLARER